MSTHDQEKSGLPRSSNGGHVAQRRRTEESTTIPNPEQLNWNEMYTMEGFSGNSSIS